MRELTSYGKFIRIELIKVLKIVKNLTLLIGLGGTYSKTGIYNNKNQDYNYLMNNGLSVSLEQLAFGYNETPYLDNPFQRFNINIEQYPAFLDDIDDIQLEEHDNFERFKPFKMKEGTSSGGTTVIP